MSNWWWVVIKGSYFCRRGSRVENVVSDMRGHLGAYGPHSQYQLLCIFFVTIDVCGIPFQTYKSSAASHPFTLFCRSFAWRNIRNWEMWKTKLLCCHQFWRSLNQFSRILKHRERSGDHARMWKAVIYCPVTHDFEKYTVWPEGHTMEVHCDRLWLNPRILGKSKTPQGIQQKILRLAKKSENTVTLRKNDYDNTAPKRKDKSPDLIYPRVAFLCKNSIGWIFSTSFGS